MEYATCTLNGQNVPCDSAFTGLGSNFGIMLGAFLGFFVIMFLMSIIIFVSYWKIYQKAGKPGWAAIVPIYNIIVLLEIIKKPTWWILLFFVPFANIIILFLMVHELSKVFGKDIGFTFGLIFLPVIFFPILGFGKSAYLGGVVPNEPYTVPRPPVPPTPTSL